MDQSNREMDGRRSAEAPERKEYRPPIINRIDVGRRTASGVNPADTEENAGVEYCAS